MLDYPLLMIFPVAMAFAAAMDVLTMTIPNRISLALVAAFAVAAPLAGLSLEQIGYHLAAGGAVLLAGMAMFFMRWIGGGDAKLMAAASLWIGFDKLMPYFFYIALIGGLLSAAIILYRRFPFDAWKLPAWALRLHGKETGIPYGVAIAGAALLVYPHTPLFAAFAG